MDVYFVDCNLFVKKTITMQNLRSITKYSISLYGGRSHDNFVVGDIQYLDYIYPGNQVLADRGFNIKEPIFLKCAELIIMPTAKGQAQMTTEDARPQVANKKSLLSQMSISISLSINKVIIF